MQMVVYSGSDAAALKSHLMAVFDNDFLRL